MSSQKPSRKIQLDKLRAAVADAPDSARAHLRLGSALLKTQSLRIGEEHLQKALELDPECIEAWVNLGGALMTHWDFQGCVDANAKALEIQPDLLQAHYNKGLGHLYLGEPEAMLACFERVVELDSSHPGGTYHLAVAQLAVKNVADAQVNLAKAMHLGYQPEPKFLKALEKQQSDKASDKDEKSSTQDDGSAKDNTTQ